MSLTVPPGQTVALVGTTGAVRALVASLEGGIPAGLWCYHLDRERLLMVLDRLGKIPLEARDGPQVPERKSDIQNFDDEFDRRQIELHDDFWKKRDALVKEEQNADWSASSSTGAVYGE